MSDLERAAFNVIKLHDYKGDEEFENAISDLARAIDNHKPNAVPDSHRALIEHCGTHGNVVTVRDMEAWSVKARKLGNAARADLPDTFKHHCVRAGCDGVPTLVGDHTMSTNTTPVCAECPVCNLRGAWFFSTNPNHQTNEAWATWYNDSNWNTRGDL